MLAPIARYRELAPCEALREHVAAFFSFAPYCGERTGRRRVLYETMFRAGEPCTAPLFADGGVSLVVHFGRSYCASGRWYDGGASTGVVIGAMTRVGAARETDLTEMVGVYFLAGRAGPFLGSPTLEVTDCVVALDELWGAGEAALPAALYEVAEETRIDRLERALLARLARARAVSRTVDAAGLARWALARRGELTVERMSEAAGVSRQTLARAFRETVGVTPKVYCMIARFQSALGYADRDGAGVDWAHVAAELGYSDQSHLIVDFRRFSSLTPGQLSNGRWFHPFIQRAKARSRAARFSP